MEIILETIIILLFRYPGALLRWLFLRRKRTFKSILNDDDAYVNAMFSLVVLALIIVLIKYLFF